MDTDMIGIDSAEEMRRKIKEKIKEEKEKNIKNVINIRIKTIDEKNCKSVFKGLYIKYKDEMDSLNSYEKKYYTSIFDNISDLIAMLFTECCMRHSKEDIIKDYLSDSLCGVTSLEDMGLYAQVAFCSDYNVDILAPCLVKYMTDILNKTDV